MRTTGRQLDQADAAVWPCGKCPDIWSFMIGGVVPDDMNDALVGVAGLDPGEKLRGADPIYGGWFDKWRVKGFRVDRTVNIHSATLCRGRDRFLYFLPLQVYSRKIEAGIHSHPDRNAFCSTVLKPRIDIVYGYFM